MRTKTMKKAFAAFCVALLGMPSLHAQEDVTVRFGLKLAPNMSWLRPDTRGIESNGSTLGYTFGLMADFPIGPTGNYMFGSGLYIQNLGGGYTQDYTFVENVNSTPQVKALGTDVHLRYIDFPLTIKMRTNEIGYMRYFAQIGTNAGFNIRAKADIEQPLISGTLTDGTPIVAGFTLLEEEDFQDQTNIFRSSMIIGGGLEYNFSGNTSLLVGILYSNGFTNLLDGVDYNGQKTKVYTDYLELTVGLFF